MQKSVADIRRDYSHQSLNEKDAHGDPIEQFAKWWNEALEAKIDEANAMTLATASTDGLPSARIVLLKGFSKEGFVFFTNYESFKGRQLEENPKACLVFFWKELERQVRITGIVTTIDPKLSDEYFYSRPINSQVGAVASPQSRVIDNRQWLDQQFEALMNKLKDSPVKRPEYWGGYIVRPVVIEFWQGRPSRLHDRLQYSLQENGSWLIERLAP